MGSGLSRINKNDRLWLLDCCNIWKVQLLKIKQSKYRSVIARSSECTVGNNEEGQNRHKRVSPRRVKIPQRHLSVCPKQAELNASNYISTDIWTKSKNRLVINHMLLFFLSGFLSAYLLRVVGSDMGDEKRPLVLRKSYGQYGRYGPGLNLQYIVCLFKFFSVVENGHGALHVRHSVHRPVYQLEDLNRDTDYETPHHTCNNN